MLHVASYPGSFLRGNKAMLPVCAWHTTAWVYHNTVWSIFIISVLFYMLCTWSWCFYKGKSYHTPTHTQTCPLILCTLHTPHPHTPAKFISPSGGPGDNVGEPYAIVQALCILLVGQFPWHQPWLIQTWPCSQLDRENASIKNFTNHMSTALTHTNKALFTVVQRR